MISNEVSMYTVRLSHFEGPLDSLLHLARKSKIDLKDVLISEITEQYLQYKKQSLDENPAHTCDFLRTASSLLYMKSVFLLPGKHDVAEESHTETSTTTLIQQLKTFEAYKTAANALRARDGLAIRMLSRFPMILRPQNGRDELRLETQSLFDAAARIAKRNREMKAPARLRVSRGAWRTADQKRRILDMLRSAGRTVLFENLLTTHPGRQEIAASFAAVLELWSEGEVSLMQKSVFDSIEICAAGDGRAGSAVG